MSSRETPPYRADHVGSLLRPPELLQAREAFANSKIDADELRGVEDTAIRDAVKLQEDVGLKSATDGEFRRATWHMDFIYSLGGVQKTPGQLKVKFHNADGDIEWTPAAMHVDSKITLEKPIFADHFEFLQSVVTTATPKLTIPSPSMVHYRGGRAAIEESVYPDMDQFWADLTSAYADEVRALHDLGCRYLQFDDTSLAYLNDPNQRAEMAAKVDDAEHLHEAYIRHINEALSGRPEGMAVTTHMCRGNFRSSWVAEGGYDFVAEALFNELDVDGFFMEWDDARSGGFEPLRFVPKGKVVVLGLVTTKSGELETKELLKRRIEEATQYVDLDQLCLSPQCGFSSTVEGNALTVEQEIDKLRLVVETAEEVWGSLMISSRRPPLLFGFAAAALGVASTTLILYALRDVAPVVSLGVVYLVAVLAVASIWGAWLGLATALASALAFNFFHIPPTGRFTITGGENWVALIIFFGAAVLASSLTELARRRTAEASERRQEADLSAEMARLLLRGGRLEEALPAVAERLARSLDARSASIVARAEPGTFPLREGPRQIGTLTVDASEPVLRRIQARIVPSLEALLAAALERDALMNDAVETAALRRSDVIKTALLRSVSHDLRSPLTAILASAEALKLAPEERVELAEAITEEATRLSRLIDNLLDLSRLEAGAAEARPEWSSIEEVLAAAVEDVPSGDFKLVIDGDLPPVKADAAQLERAFSNLLENAQRHSGGHPVSVRARDVGGRILVRVVDRGPGVPKAHQERIFEPFYRSGSRGSGLGLAIVRGFVEANGGRVWVESLPDQATSFVVELPVPQPLAP